MGSNIDVYQRDEGSYRLMCDILAALRDHANPFSILTKATLITRDLDLLGRPPWSPDATGAGAGRRRAADAAVDLGEALRAAVRQIPADRNRRMEVRREHRDLRGLMGDRLAWLVAAALTAVTLCGAGVIVFIAVRRRPAAPAAAPMAAVARTHFVGGGGYVELGRVVVWASADPALRIRPGHVLRYEPGDGRTITVISIVDSTPEERRT